MPKTPKRRIGADSEKRAAEFAHVADALRAIRRQHKLTQEDMAPILGISFAGYRPYERGERDLTQSQIEKIAAGVGVSVFAIARYLWPDESPALVELRFSHEWAEIQRQAESLPEPVREMVLRAARQSIEIANGASDLARRN